MDLGQAPAPKRMKLETVKGEFECIMISFERLANFLSMTSGEERPANALSILREEYNELRKAGVKKGAYLAHCSRMLTKAGFGGGSDIFPGRYCKFTANWEAYWWHESVARYSGGTYGRESTIGGNDC